MSKRPPLAGMSAVKLALLARKAREQSATVLQADPVAIVGMACRAPGGADSPQRLWQLLCEGRDAVREVPPDRWDAAAWFDPDPSAAGKSSTRHGGFLDRIDGFDAGYFNLLPREAERMDPQQRLVLEVAVEGIDDAGIDQQSLRGSRSGVFIASYHNDYAGLQYRDLEAVDARTLTGTLHSVLANRLSYFLDLRGPSISIDSACSSSLVAIHLACQSLRSGETDLALAGGVSLMVSPELMVSMSKVGFMAPDGRSKVFDANADGFGRGEGCGLVVLKRLSDAIADGDRVLAVIRGTAVNSDGHSTLLAAPNGLAQQAMIREALANAQLEPARIGYVEAHGTGTALGDPIELEALAATVGRAFADAGPCYVGSIKANIGHLEAAAGVTGLIKAVLVLQNRAIPPQVHFSRLNPHIDLGGTRLAIPDAMIPWHGNGLPRCAAISSFGVGGTNAHVIVEEAGVNDGAASDEPGEQRSFILPLSARDPAALRDLAAAWIPFLEQTGATASDLCHTAARRRSHFGCRLAVVADSVGGLRTRLQEYQRDQSLSQDPSGPMAAPQPPGIGFIFSGQGPQWHAMGSELLAQEPVFADVLARCDARLRPLAGWSLLEELAAPQARSRIESTEFAQPALFAIQAGIVALLQSWGFSPHAVAGHSVGEIGALHAAGALSLDDALEIVCRRGRIMQAAEGLGRMVSASLSHRDALALLTPYADRLSIAAINSSRSVVISGDTEAVESIVAMFVARGIEHRMLPVRYAFHSAQMAPFQLTLAEELTRLRAAAPVVPFYSTVTGARVADGVRLDGKYFAANLRQPVRFADAIAAMAADGCSAFVEISPHPVLAASITECLEAAGGVSLVVPTLRRGRAEREALLQACASLYVAGAVPRWQAIQPKGGRLETLPAYPWQRTRHWIRRLPQPGAAAAAAAGADGADGADGAAAAASRDAHPLLGRAIAVAGARMQVLEGRCNGELEWLVEHRIFGRVPMPAAGVLEIFLAAARATGHIIGALRDMTMHRPMFLAEGAADACRWQCVVRRSENGTVELGLHEAVRSDPGAEVQWNLVASAGLADGADAGGESRLDVSPVDSLLPIATDAAYARFAELGVEFGPRFRCLDGVLRQDGHAQGWLQLPDDLADGAARYLMHPVLLDGALQLCSIALPAGASGEVPAIVALPLGIARLQLLRPTPRRLLARARVTEVAASGSFEADVTLESTAGEVIAIIQGARFAPAQAAAFAARATAVEAYDIGWSLQAPLPARDEGGASRAGGLWLVMADTKGLGRLVAGELEAAGGRTVLVVAGETCRRIDEDSWSVDPSKPEHFRTLLDSIDRRRGETLRGILHLWGLDAACFGDMDQHSLPDQDVAATGSALHLAQALAGAGLPDAPPLWLVTRGAQVVTAKDSADLSCPRAAGIWGLGNVIRVEHPELDARLVDLDAQADLSVQALSLVDELLSGSRHSGAVAVRDEGRWVPELVRYPRAALADDGQKGRASEGPHADPRPAGAPLELRLVRAGTLDGLALLPATARTPGPGEVMLRVVAAGLNFRDVLLALGMYPGEAPPLGAECAGIVCAVGTGVEQFHIGQQVFGLAPGSLGTEVVVPAAYLAPVPSWLDIVDAAATPVAFLTAWHGLHRLAGLRSGERVLIHAAAGGVGLAAVQLAIRRGAQVFATAGSERKRALLRSMNVAHVMDSRSLGFAQAVRDATGGEGVDVVLNSLAGDFIRESLDVLAPGGCFLELGKRGVMTEAEVAQARPDVRYHVYDLGSEALADPGIVRPLLDQVVAALKDGSLRALPVETFDLGEAQQAFRHMAQARHIGKVVLRNVLRRPDALGNAQGVQAKPLVSPQATYWITGGCGGLGLATARWLVDGGARSLVLTGRNPPSQAAATVLRTLEASGARIRVCCADASDRDAMQAVFDLIAASDAPLRGVIHAAGIIDDAILVNQTWARCRRVLKAKADSAWVLHRLTRDAGLDFFVLYSAAGVVLGASGQAGYSAANAQLDALARVRRRAGLPALSVAWGPWSEVGMAAGLAERGIDAWSGLGLGVIEPAQALAQLEQLLRGNATYAAVMAMHWPTFLRARRGRVDSRFFRALQEVPADEAAVPSSPAPAARADGIVAELHACPATQRRALLIDYLGQRALQVLGLPAHTPLDPKVPVKEIGLDSLMAVELRNLLARSFARQLPATLLFDFPTLEKLSGYLLRLLEIPLPSTTAAPTAIAAAALLEDDLGSISEQEAEALLLEELDDGAAGGMR